jgi:hypothetical protein
MHFRAVLPLFFLVTPCLSAAPGIDGSLPVPRSVAIHDSVIDAKANGLAPDTGKDCTAAVAALLEEARAHPGTTVKLAPGHYDFHKSHAHTRRHVQSNTTVVDPRRSAVLLEHHRGTVLDGGAGAVFVLHGELTGIALDDCEGVTLRGLRVTMSRLLTTQAKVVEQGDGWQIVEIDPKRFPYKITDGNFSALAPETKPARVFSMMEVDPATGRNLDGDGRPFQKAEELAPGRIKIFGGKRVQKPGHLLILRHHPRTHAGMFVHGSRRITLENVEFWGTAGLGILSQQSADLSYLRTHIRPEPGTGLFCGPKDDGFHFSGCSGHILLDGCHVSGTADDPINIHGTCLSVVELKDPVTIVARFGHNQSIGQPLWARPGDRLALNDKKTLLTAATATVKSYRLLDKRRAEIVLDKPFSVPPAPSHALENLTDCPSATIRRCIFENNRARGILCTTSGKVLVEDNVFRIAGAAILIAGDANGWFESGAVRDVTIRRNRFENCLISPTQFSDGVIAIWPEIRKDVPGKFFHSNIRIENNTFLTFGGPLLYAHNVGNLVFSGNTITPTKAFPAWHRLKCAIWLKHTRDIVIEGNKATGPLPATAIEVHGEGGDSLRIGPGQPFSLK